MINKFLTAFGITALFTVAAIAAPQTANAQAAEVDNPEVTTQQEQGDDDSNDDSYLYVAQPGDSYSVLARKAVQTFGIDNDTNLSGAQIVFAETNLTLSAGSPELNEGQTVSISKESVKQWIDKAKQLTDAQQAAWNQYVPYIQFNTDNNGE